MLEIEVNNGDYRTFIDYIYQKSDSFSMMFEKDEDSYVLQEVYNMIVGFIIKQKTIGVHPNTNTEFHDSDYVRVKNNKVTRKLLMSVAELDEWNGVDFPEELCFYSGNSVVFYYISHERLAFINEIYVNK